jgi:uncharacterized protein YbaR (Trm112 family)
MSGPQSPSAIDPRLLELICCPLTKGMLAFDSARSELVSVSAKLAYPVREGIPIMLPSEARQLDEEEIERRRSRS